MSLTWPFVGRDGELRLIREAMQSGNGVVLAGAPGVGKTRLAHEATASVDPGQHTSLWAVATPATTPIPLGALFPLLPAGLPTSPLALLRGAADALLERAGTHRLVLGVDDAHLLDDISATVVYQLARAGRAFVLATLRSGHSVPDAIKSLWQDGYADRVEIAPLTLAETADVLVAALGDQVDKVTSRRLCQAVRGNLLFLRELVDAGLSSGALTEIAGVWSWSGPWVTTPRLVELISERIGRLDPREQRVLQLVAYGEPIDADLLISLVDWKTVEEAEFRNLLDTRQNGRRVDVRLAHPLYGEVLRAGCSPERAAALRCRLADAVEATGAPRADDWLRIATWRLDAAAPVQPELLVTAAHRALVLLDMPLAERLARTAFEASGDPAAATVLWRVLFLSGRNVETEDVMARLADIPMSDSQGGDYTVGRASNLFFGLHQADEAFALLRHGREVIADRDWRDEMDLVESVFHLLQANLSPAQRGLAELRDRTGLSPRTAARALVAHGVALVHQGRLRLATEALDQASEPIARWADEIPWVPEVRRMYRCYAALFAGRLREAGELATAFHTHAVQTEWQFSLRLSGCLQAQVARLRGQVRTAARWAREAAHGRLLPGAGAPFRNYVFGELAHAEALAGRAGPAVAAVTEADRRPAPSEALLQPWIELARPWIAVATGDLALAVERAVTAAEYARHQQAAGFEAFALHDTVRLRGARSGVIGPAGANLAVDRLGELAETTESDLVGAFAQHAVAAANEDPVGLEAVGIAFAGMGADLLAAEAYVQAADTYRRFGTSASDRRLRAQAALLLDGCEGARTPLVADVEAPQLTLRERDIARLAAGGLSNQQIADHMVISPRTVGNHLHHVYAKLGISGRSALAALLPPVGPDI